MKKETYTISLFIITMVMLCMVFFIAKHYKNEVENLEKRIKKLETLIK